MDGLRHRRHGESRRNSYSPDLRSPRQRPTLLHHVLDLWLEQEVRPRLHGRMRVIRFADDFVIGFEREDDARRVMAVLSRRFERYELKLHPDKTRLFHFARPCDAQRGGKGPEPFDFLGFTIYWRRTRKGSWALGMKTRKARQRRALESVDEWCRRHRCLPIKAQHAALRRRLAGHYNYFAISGNNRCIAALDDCARRIWHKWLTRRSQRSRMTWERYAAMLRAYPLPAPTVRVCLWA